MGHRRAVIYALVSIIVGLTLSPGFSAARASEDQLPDLIALPPSGVFIGPPNQSYDPLDPRTPMQNDLKFTVDIPNAGQWAVDIQAIKPGPEPLSLEGEQCVAWVNRWVCSQRESVGPLVWHQQHLHWHFNNFALYELRRLNPDRTPDMSEQGLVSNGSKASFCLEDTLNYSNQPITDSPPSYETCTATRQGISPGWLDEYDNTLPGQELPIIGVPDGDYALVITVNPDRTLFESNYNDNTAYAIVRIEQQGTVAEVVP
jgi:Lysyl oxidase